MHGRFCVRCGKEEAADNPIIDGLCLECFIKERVIVNLPSKLILTICPVCGSVYIKGKWEFSESVYRALENYIMQSVIKRSSVYPGFTVESIKVINWSSGYVRLGITATYKRKGIKVSQQLGVHVEIRKRVCPTCFKSRGGSYEAILQIRSLGPMRLKVIRDLGERLSRIRKFRENVVEIKEHKEGVDVKLGDQSICRYVANLLKRDYAAKIKVSWENTGRLGNRRRSKLIISARIPCLLKGDIIEFKGVPAQVTGLTRGKVMIKKLDDGKTFALNHETLWKEGIKYLSEKDYAIVEGRLLNYEGGKAVVQSIRTGNIYYLKPPRIYNVGSAVKVLIYKGKAYLLI